MPLEEIPDTPRSVEVDSDEEEAGLDDEEKLVRRRQRAMAVSAESIDPKTLKERLKLVPVVDKDIETEDRLASVSLWEEVPVLI